MRALERIKGKSQGRRRKSGGRNLSAKKFGSKVNLGTNKHPSVGVRRSEYFKPFTTRAPGILHIVDYNSHAPVFYLPLEWWNEHLESGLLFLRSRPAFWSIEDFHDTTR